MSICSGYHSCEMLAQRVETIREVARELPFQRNNDIDFSEHTDYNCPEIK